jgi:hypothetical protein
MSRVTRFMVIGVLAVLAGPGRSADARGPWEDDLALVRRAVAEEPASTRPEEAVSEKRPARKGEPQWLRVRIKEKSGKSTVSVNVPLALARALGGDLPIDLACRHHRGDDGHAKVRLRDVLASLDSGQDIVQVESEDGSVRVWVD